MRDNTHLQANLRQVALLAMDVDGVLTDGRVTWAADAAGGLTELKSFCVKDGLAFGIVRAAGLKSAWITGRTSPVVEKRASELGIDHLAQAVRNKRAVLQELASRLALTPEQVLYVGDDLNDLLAFEAAGVRVAVADATEAVREQADWVTRAPGGHGAIREVVEEVLRAQGVWERAVREFLARLEGTQ